MRRFFISILSLAAIASEASTQAPAPQLEAATAQAIVAGCARHASGRSQSQAIAVVDRGGQLVAALRMDRNGYGAMDFALAKARAAAAWGFSTSGMEEAVRDTPGFAAAPHVVTVPGGVPIFSADGLVRIGAVGVSGGPPPDDVACAEAGIAAGGLRSAPAPR